MWLLAKTLQKRDLDAAIHLHVYVPSWHEFNVTYLNVPLTYHWRTCNIPLTYHLRTIEVPLRWPQTSGVAEVAANVVKRWILKNPDLHTVSGITWLSWHSWLWKEQQTYCHIDAHAFVCLAVLGALPVDVINMYQISQNLQLCTEYRNKKRAQRYRT